MPQINMLHTIRARDLAADIACGLQRHGYAVPWNPDAAITAEFDKAKPGDCFVVLWTRDAATSRWVWSAAVDAFEHGALVEVLLEPIESPFNDNNPPIDFSDVPGDFAKTGKRWKELRRRIKAKLAAR
jgi:hypothetical protein